MFEFCIIVIIIIIIESARVHAFTIVHIITIIITIIIVTLHEEPAAIH